MAECVRGAPIPGVQNLEMHMATERVKITWNGTGGELDSVVVKYDPMSPRSDYVLSKALVKLIGKNIVTPGDTFEVRTVQS